MSHKENENSIKFSIIIPYYNHWDLTHARLSEIYNHLHGENYEVILINDASPESDCHTGAIWWKKEVNKFPILYHKNRKNLGFGGSHNVGAKLARGEVFVFLSNDVVISGNFLPHITKILETTNGNIIIGGRVLYTHTGWNSIIINGKPSIISYPEGWLIAVTREMWNRFGGWDVQTYGKFDYEDVDIGAWAAYNDVPLIGLQLASLTHLSGRTINAEFPDREKFTFRNRDRFRNKWTKLLEDKFNEQK